MKKTFILLALIFPLVLVAQQPVGRPELLPFPAIYADPVAGSDSLDGTTPGSAVRSLGRAQVLALATNARVIALSDTVHYGTLSLNNWDGNRYAPKLITTYHVYGNKSASIKGIKRLTGWKNAGNHLWSVYDRALPDKRYFEFRSTPGFYGDYPRYKYFLNGLFINGKWYQMAQTPNAGAFTTDAVAPDSVSYFDETNELSMKENQYQGGYCYIMNEDWVATKAEITRNTATRIYLKKEDFFFYDLVSATNQKTHKYKIVNDVDCADLDGEWVYDPARQTLTLRHRVDPATLDIWVPCVDTVLSIYNCSYVDIRNVDIWSGNKASLQIVHSDNIRVQDCNLYYGAYAGAWVGDSYDVYFEADTILYSNGNGIAFRVSRPAGSENVNHCYLYDCGTNGVLGDRDGSTACGILSQFSNASARNFSYNHINRTGYNGIGLVSSIDDKNGTAWIYRNLVMNWCMHYQDGAGIYLGYENDNTSKIIRGNMFLNAGNSAAFSRNNTSFTMGIYWDTETSYYTADSNTIYNTPVGIFLQGYKTSAARPGAVHNKALCNTLVKFDAPGAGRVYRGGFYKEVNSDHINDYTAFMNNVVVGTDPDFSQLFTWHHDGSIEASGMKIQENHYFNPFRKDGKIFGSRVNWELPELLTLQEWQALSGWETGSTVNSVTMGDIPVSGTSPDQRIWLFCNWSDRLHEFSLGSAAFKDLKGNSVMGSLRVAPFSSTVLLHLSGNVRDVDNPVFITGR